jgi:TPR repeat protein/ankyrin repeat protein/uncharacterized protein YecT (DUF1311 family)
MRIQVCAWLLMILLPLSAYAGFDEGMTAFDKHDYVQAFNEWMPLALSGKPDAQAKIADLYLNGQGMLQDVPAAVQWYGKAADKGNSHAQLTLGILYAEGKLVPADLNQAIHWYELAAKQGEVGAQINLGVMYSDGKLVAKDMSQALHWMAQAANQGHALAQYNLGLWYFEGKGIPRDYVLARSWYLKSANQGNLGAQCNLAIMYHDGTGGPVDKVLALSWFNKAAEQGSAAAQTSLGALYNRGDGVERDYEKAVQWTVKASDQGFAKAQANLGLIYSLGQGVAQSDAQAAKFYGLAADQGLVEVQSTLGKMYYDGKGVKQDYAKALKWYRKAAAQDNLPAELALGYMYDRGEGVTKDDDVAAEWYRKAALHGDKVAQSNLEIITARHRDKNIVAPEVVINEKVSPALDLQGLVLAGKLEEIKSFLAANKFDLSVRNEKGANVLDLAVESRHPDVVSLLIQSGADVNQKNDDGVSALHRAAFWNVPEVIPVLAKLGATLDIEDKFGRSPLYYAAERGNTTAAEALVAAGTNVELQNGHQVTAFGEAISSKHKEIAELILSKNAAVDTVDAWLMTPLDYASDLPGWHDIVQMILDRGAPCSTVRNNHAAIDTAADIETVKLLIKCVFKETGTAPSLNDTLYHAARRGDLDLVSSLVALGADVNGRTRNIGDIPLIAALSADNQKEMLELLVNLGADPNASSRLGETMLQALTYNYRSSSGKLVEFLVAHGANVNARVQDQRPQFGAENIEHGDTALHRAVARGQLEYAQVLIAKGADIEALSSRFETPLALALENKRLDMAKMLVERGAKLNPTNGSEITPLLGAIHSQDIVMVQFALENGATVNAAVTNVVPNKPVGYPLQSAIEAGDMDIVKLLIHAGADVNAKTQNEMTALNVAVMYDRFDAARLLLDHGADQTLASREGTPLYASTANPSMRALLLASQPAERGKKDRMSDDQLCSTVAKLENKGVLRAIVKSDQYQGGIDFRGEQGIEGAANEESGWVELDGRRFLVGRTDRRLVYLQNTGSVNLEEFQCTFEVKNGLTLAQGPLDRLLFAAQRSHQDSLTYVMQHQGVAAFETLTGMVGHNKKESYWKSQDGLSAILFAALQNNRTDIVKLLLDRGANPNRGWDKIKLPDENDMVSAIAHTREIQGAGASPLYIAVEGGHRDAAKILLEHGADPNAKDEHTRWHITVNSAVNHEDQRLIALLLKHGVDPASLGRSGFDNLLRQRRNDTVALFLSYGLSLSDIGYTGPELQTGPINKQNPDVVELIIRFDSLKKSQICHTTPAKFLEDICVPRELRMADIEINREFAAVLAASSRTEQTIVQANQRVWLRDRNQTCKLKLEPDTRDGWISYLMADHEMATCVLDKTRERINFLSKKARSTNSPVAAP